MSLICAFQDESTKSYVLMADRRLTFSTGEYVDVPERASYSKLLRLSDKLVLGFVGECRDQPTIVSAVRAIQPELESGSDLSFETLHKFQANLNTTNVNF